MSGKKDSLPVGGIRVGNRIMFPDLSGNLHSTPGSAINSNINFEKNNGRGMTGGCGQDPKQAPNPKSK